MKKIAIINAGGDCLELALRCQAQGAEVAIFASDIKNSQLDGFSGVIINGCGADSPKTDREICHCEKTVLAVNYPYADCTNFEDSCDLLLRAFIRDLS